MSSSLLLISGLCWLIIGGIIGFYLATNRLIHNEELNEKLEELRKLRYEADRAKTIYHVAKMVDRVNENLLLDIFKQIDSEMSKAKEKLNANQD